MADAPATEPMHVEQSATLADFARACRTAARSVALYPATHPAIRGALARVVTAAQRLAAAGDVTISVLPDALSIDGRAPARPDPAIAEFASLLHDRMIGALTLGARAGDEDWHAVLLLLSRSPEDIVADGGITRAWAATGRAHFAFREIDYAEVLRERAGGDVAAWDRIIASCLQGQDRWIDERTLATLLDAVGDSARFGELLRRFEQAAVSAGSSIGIRAAALLHLLRATLDAAAAVSPERADAALRTVATAVIRLSPDMMLAVIAGRSSADAGDAAMASSILGRIGEEGTASFVAASVVRERGATDRLAQAFAALIPDEDRKAPVLEAAHAHARDSEAGREAGFADLWQRAAEMLTSYSDRKFVSEEYGRELSNARLQAIEVERVSDDPPERIHAWIATVSDSATRQLDLDLLLDLLRIVDEPDHWREVAAIVGSEVERRAVLGDITGALQLMDGIVRETGEDGRTSLQVDARQQVASVLGGRLLHHIVLQLRQADDKQLEPLNRLCHSIGAGIIRPLAVALATEDNARAIKRLRELLLGFGAAARESVEPLRNASNPAVRRTAIDLLRVLGGDETLPELISMLNDADQQVQHDSIRAIVQIGTPKAYAALQQALAAGPAARDVIVQQILLLRDKKAIPLLCYVLTHTTPRGTLAQAHSEIVDALGALSAHPDSVQALRHVLYRTGWWSPFKTAALRRAAAAALRRLGSPEAIGVLQDAAAGGSRRVRAAARAHASLAARRDKDRA